MTTMCRRNSTLSGGVLHPGITHISIGRAQVVVQIKMPAMTPRFTVGMNRAFGRRPCAEPVPFQEILPLKLKDSVSGKGDKTSDVACLQDMAVMFACLKKHDFNEALCPKEIGSFKSCYKNFVDSRENSKGEEAAVGTKGRLHFKQLNKVLAKYPNM